MILATHHNLEDLGEKIAIMYKSSDITIEPAPGDDNRWFVIRDGLVLSGMHIVKKSYGYVFGITA